MSAEKTPDEVLQTRIDALEKSISIDEYIGEKEAELMAKGLDHLDMMYQVLMLLRDIAQGQRGSIRYFSEFYYLPEIKKEFVDQLLEDFERYYETLEVPGEDDHDG